MIARKASAYLVAIPKSAVTHIQKIAPGPPKKIAVATPAIFPVPTVADNAVIRESKEDISPSSSVFDFLNKDLNPYPRLKKGNPFKPKVK